MKRRGMLLGLLSLGSVPFVGRVADASTGEPAFRTLLDAPDGEPLAVEKPLTTEGMAKVLLTQAERAKRQGLAREASILREAALKLLALPDRIGVVPCDTDADCEQRNPHLREQDSKADDPLGLRDAVRQF